MSNTPGVGDLIYDANIYDGLNTSLSDLKFYKQWLPKDKNSKLLELCCGTGRLTIPIAKDGYRIYGVDNNVSMLDKAKEKALESGLNIKFIEADIRELHLPETFDLIFIPFNSIHHLYKTEDFVKVLAIVRNHLNKGGRFLFDCYNPNIQYIVEGQKGKEKITDYFTKDGRHVIIEQSMHYESHNQINRIEWHYYINGEFDSIQNMDMRLYFPQELDFYLKSSGFSILKKFGDFEETSFHNNSEKQIFICELIF